MTFRSLAVSLLAALAALPAFAQDRVTLLNGTVMTDGKVKSFDVRKLVYTKGGSDDTISTDQIAKVELGKFKDALARGLRDPGIMLTMAKEQMTEKNPLLAQFAFVSAATQYFDDDKPVEGVAALDEMVKGIPEAGLLPEVYRQKFEFYMGTGKNARDAAAVAKKYASDALSGAWPGGLGTEAEFFSVLAERGQPKDFQSKLRAIASKAGGNNPVVASRASVELGHSLRETKDVEGATKLYDEVLRKDNSDQSARAGALLGLGKITYESAAAGDKEPFKKALLMFLRVRLETKDAWPSLQAEALYYAALAAQKWGGPESGLIQGRCRNTLGNEFAGTEWAARAKEGR